MTLISGKGRGHIERLSSVKYTDTNVIASYNQNKQPQRDNKYLSNEQISNQPELSIVKRYR